VAPDLSKMRPVDPTHVPAGIEGVASGGTSSETTAVVARYVRVDPPLKFGRIPDLGVLKSRVASCARVALRGVQKETKTRDGTLVTLVLDAEALRLLRDALTRWDDALHAVDAGDV